MSAARFGSRFVTVGDYVRRESFFGDRFGTVVQIDPGEVAVVRWEGGRLGRERTHRLDVVP